MANLLQNFIGKQLVKFLNRCGLQPIRDEFGGIHFLVREIRAGLAFFAPGQEENGMHPGGGADDDVNTAPAGLP
jgi:hypothetical protein